MIRNIQMALVGLTCNLSVVAFLRTMPSLRNSFGSLTLSQVGSINFWSNVKLQAIVDSVHQFLFAFYFAPTVYLCVAWSVVNEKYLFSVETNWCTLFLTILDSPPWRHIKYNKMQITYWMNSRSVATLMCASPSIDLLQFALQCPTQGYLGAYLLSYIVALNSWKSRCKSWKVS